MLLYASCNDTQNKKKIETAVGKPFTIADRAKIGGVHSPEMDIIASSIQLHNLLILNQADSTCTIELRPKGIVLRFTAILDRYALVVPYHKLVIHKVNTNIYTIYKDSYYIKADVRDEAGRDFIKKILKSKSDSFPTFIDDL